MLVRNHLLCPYSICNANKRTGELKIQVLVNQTNGERIVGLKPTIRGKRKRTDLSYNFIKEGHSGLSCPYCNRSLEVVIDETHSTRYVHLRQAK